MIKIKCRDQNEKKVQNVGIKSAFTPSIYLLIFFLDKKIALLFNQKNQ